jgi:hypothetical protein
MDELTDHGNDPWIYDVDDGALVPDKALLWGLIATLDLLETFCRIIL